MSQRNSTILIVAVLGLLLAIAGFAFSGWSLGGEGGIPSTIPDSSESAKTADLSADEASVEHKQVGLREAVVELSGRPTGVRGRIVDVKTGEPLAGVEVLAMRQPPSLERLMSRFRSTFFQAKGAWSSSAQPPVILGQTLSAADGSFEILGLETGVVFLDGRSDFTFVRTPGRVRLAAGEIVEGVELLGSPGGRVRGVVMGPDGLPASGSMVSVRPGLNAFLGQITQRKYRWLETMTDAEGRYDLPGVPEGAGYTLAATGPLLALEEVHGVDVTEGQVTTVNVQGHAGAELVGRVTRPDGTPAVGANVALVYLDLSRVLFSADGRDEPITTDDEGYFHMRRVAAGRVAFVAAADGFAPSNIEEMAVVDGGIYEDLELELADGVGYTGLVVDDAGRPVPGALVEIRPMERPKDPNFLKMILKIRTVDTKTGGDGRFFAQGLSGERLFLQVSKPGYVTEVRFGLKTDEDDKRITLTRGVTIRGKVLVAAGEQDENRPLTRFRVSTRSREVKPEKSGEKKADGGDRADGDKADGENERGRRWGRGRFGRGRGRGGMREGSMRLGGGSRFGEGGMQAMGGNWREFIAADGSFEIVGVPPGKIRIEVRAEGYRNPEKQELVLTAGETSEELTFTLDEGAIARGVVVDADGSPAAGVQVTAYASRKSGSRRSGPFRMNMDPEDMDFLGLAGMSGRRRSATTDRLGKFEVVGLSGGKHRFTARHPDRAKTSVKDVEISTELPTEGIVIELVPGGGVEGQVTGAGGRPLGSALVVAASLSAGSFKSSTTNRDGFYKIEGLSPGQYIVFKSRMDERSMNIAYDLMGNMRLKSIAVRKGRVSRLDIHDASENSVRVYGVVRDGQELVSRGMVTAIGKDKDGIFGMGVRAKPTDKQGEYELVGLEPGDYFFQVTRFQGRPEQASLSIEVPEGVREVRIDLDLPQSFVKGRVVDSQGAPVEGIQVAAGVEKGGIEGAPGLLGLIMKNGVAQARTDENGEFSLRRLAPGTYRITASGQRSRRGRGAESPFGQVAREGVVIDGVTSVGDLLLVLPRAGKISGSVMDASGNPIVGAEIHYSAKGRKQSKDPQEQIMDLFGVQARPSKSDVDGRFTLTGVSPGTYDVRADTEGLSPGVARDVTVIEEGEIDVAITVVKGAILKVRARNIDGGKIPFANISLLDGEGNSIVKNVSVMSVFSRMMRGKQKKENTGWYEFGSVPPDTYTVVITEAGKPDLRISRMIADGEKVEWDIDASAELEAAGRARSTEKK